MKIAAILCGMILALTPFAAHAAPLLQPNSMPPLAQPKPERPQQSAPLPEPKQSEQPTVAPMDPAPRASAPASKSLPFSGQVMIAADGARYERLIVKRGDSLWNLCMIHDWCRTRYPENSLSSKKENWKDFIAFVQKLNPGVTIGLLYPGQVINFPLSLGVATEFVRLDRNVDQLRTTNQTLLEKIDDLTKRIEGYLKEIGLLTKSVETLKQENASLAQRNQSLLNDTSTLKQEKDDLTKKNKTLLAEQARAESISHFFKVSTLILGVIMALMIVFFVVFLSMRSNPKRTGSPRPLL